MCNTRGIGFRFATLSVLWQEFRLRLEPLLRQLVLSVLSLLPLTHFRQLRQQSQALQELLVLYRLALVQSQCLPEQQELQVRLQELPQEFPPQVRPVVLAVGGILGTEYSHRLQRRVRSEDRPCRCTLHHPILCLTELLAVRELLALRIALLRFRLTYRYVLCVSTVNC